MTDMILAIAIKIFHLADTRIEPCRRFVFFKQNLTNHF